MNRHFPTSHPIQRGFTLVELLVVMVIGLILLLGVVTLLRQLHHQFRAQTAVARLNDDARFVFETMRDAFQGAGGTNPADLQFINPISNVDSTQLAVTYYSQAGCYGGTSGAGWRTVTYSRDGAQLRRVCDGDSQPLIGDSASNADYATTVDNLQFSYAVDENADQSIDCWWPPEQGSNGAAAACPPSGKATPDPADVIGVRVTLDLSARNPTPDQPNKNAQQQDSIRRQYVMTFAIDSKLGFFVPNQGTATPAPPSPPPEPPGP
jgi:prepilin-type N-terminal cleavage/methylation domain-containing protein